MTTAHLPRTTEITRFVQSKNATDIKPFLEIALDDSTVQDKIEQFLVNGGVQGHKLLDLHATAEIICEFDAKKGNGIGNKHLKAYEIVNQLKVVLRRRFILDKKCKVIGVNPKFGNLLAAPVEPSTEV